MNSPEKDYTHKSWMAVTALIAVLAALSFIPPQSIGGVKLRRANILSDLCVFDDAASEGDTEAAEPLLFDEKEFEVDMQQVAERIVADTVPREVRTTYLWDVRAPEPDAAPATLSATDENAATGQAAPIEPRSRVDTASHAASAVAGNGECQAFSTGTKEAADCNESPHCGTNGNTSDGTTTGAAGVARLPKDGIRTDSEDSGLYAPVRSIIPDTALLSAKLIPLEEPDTAGSGSMRAFCDTLLNARRPVRIAVMGDSFIEGDILTADLREKLQQTYGGGGPGFAPMASPLTAFRRTVKTQSKGWTAYNIMQRKAAPAPLRGNFFVSGWVCQPAPDASTRWEMTSYRDRLDSCTSARIFFISPRDSRIELTLNDTLRHEFEVEGDGAVRQIVVRAPRVHALGFRVLAGADGFIGYGAVFESDGVVVDNYSVRSNNGQAMFWTNPSVNAQIDAMLGYDLVILQYGLNIMQTGVKNYTAYADQIEKMVAYIRECFPTAAVLVLGVSDRSVKTDAGFAPMDAIEHMTGYQRNAAANSGAAFWPTCDAMRVEGGMERFVQNGWAGKDFTHINYAGGRRVAWALFDAINAGAGRIYARQQIERRRQAAQALLDSVRRTEIERQLLSATTDNLHTLLQ